MKGRPNTVLSRLPVTSCIRTFSFLITTYVVALSNPMRRYSQSSPLRGNSFLYVVTAFAALGQFLFGCRQ